MVPLIITHKKLNLGIIIFFVVAFISINNFNRVKSNIETKNTGQKLYLKKLSEDVKKLQKMTFIKDLFDLPESFSTYSYLFIYYDKGCVGCNSKGKELIKSICCNNLYILQLTDHESDDYFERKNYIRIHNDVDYYLHKIN